MTASALKEKVGACQPQDDLQILLNCDDRNWEAYRKLFSEALSWHMTPQSSMEPGRYSVKARITFTFGEQYWRALAKIAFHYYLCQTVRVRGDEDGFGAVREYIMNGGDRDAVFGDPRPFLQHGLHPNQVPTRWCHFLSALESRGLVRGCVCMFFGPKRRMAQHYVTLGRIHSPIITPNSRWAHAYVYDDRPCSGRTVGEVIPMPAWRMR
jgi:hypothetical protein